MFLEPFSKSEIGLGLRAPHYSAILESPPKQTWFEAIAENYMGVEKGTGGRAIRVLEKIRCNHDIVLHGVSLNIGSVDEPSENYLKRLKSLIARIEPKWTSDHLCWTGVNGENLHDLLPLPYTEEVLDHVVEKILWVQDFLGRRMLFENVSAYLTFKHSQMEEWEFLSEISRRADCGILLDINNIYVSSKNLGFNPLTYLDHIPPARVGQIHLAGHSIQKTNHGICLIDTHDRPVPEPVWALYVEAVKRFGWIPTLIEWDASIPEFSILAAEGEKARNLMEVTS